jgi:uncharacterized protein YciI
MSIAHRVALLLVLLLGGCAATRGDSAGNPPAEKHRFVILYSPGPKWIKDKPVWEQPLADHGNYMHTLFARKILVMGGPFSDSSGGMAIIDVDNEQQASTITREDPAVQSSVFTAVIHPWFPVDWVHYGQ